MIREKIYDNQPGSDAALMERMKILEEAMIKSRGYLINHQSDQGFWVGELEADASVTAGYIPLMYFMQGKVDPVKQAKAINYVKSKQNTDGSWSAYYKGPGDLNVTIQVYFALKLGGVTASDPCLQKAREFILDGGGLMKANTITRIWLAVFGQFDYKGTPSIPPECIFSPNWFVLNIYEFASWSRETILALMLILSLKPVCKVPEEANISELFLEPPEKRYFTPAQRGGLFCWKNFFLNLDSIFKTLEKSPLKPLRKPALRKVTDWVLEHQEKDGSWGGIMLPWVYSLIALKSLGYPDYHPAIRTGMNGLKIFLIEDEKTLRLQPAVSPVWDTAWVTIALIESGLPLNHYTLRKSIKWLMEKEIKSKGDWKVKNPYTSPGCWSFEFDNDIYPDIDDTAVVSRALIRYNLPGNEDPTRVEAAKRGLNWIEAMQSSDGGWAAFDRDNNKLLLNHVPYGDFITPTDHTSADVTAHALELFGVLGVKDYSRQKALAYLKTTQLEDGSWYGRWGVNYIYGTGLSLVSLKAAGEDMGQEYITRAVGWLISKQNEDGGWGETCETYRNPGLKGKGPSTASQTAWALSGLIAAGKVLSSNVEKGIEYLLRTQNEEGDWSENYYTGTGFPKAFYLKYDLYRIYFPLLTLGQYRSSLEVKNG
jgi:squalene-hopene/tetraprenyl-beta-curcumene cyclase